MPNESNPYESPTTQTSRPTPTNEQAAETGRTPSAGAITLAIVIGLFAAVGAFVATCVGVVITAQQSSWALGLALSVSLFVAVVVAIGVPVLIVRWIRQR